MKRSLVESSRRFGGRVLYAAAVVLAGSSLVVWAQSRPSSGVELQPGALFTEVVGPQRPGAGENAAAENQRVSILVHLDATLERECNERRGLRAFAGGCGAEVRFEYETVLPNVINLTNVPVREIGRIKALPGVVKVEPDFEVHAYLQDSVPLIRGLQTHTLPNKSSCALGAC